MRRFWAVAAGGSLLLAGFGVAAAQTGETSEVTSAEQKATGGGSDVMPAFPGRPAPPPFGRGPDRAGWKGGPGGPFGFEFGPGPHAPGIHGENTAPAGDGKGFRTTAHQLGEVTDVSASAITVKSEDGYERTYALDEDTLVEAGRDGIADVKKGDTVRVMAVVQGERAQAHAIVDETTTRRIREKASPEGRKPR